MYSIKPIYLDYASITPVDKRVLKEYKKALKKDWFNPSSLYKGGVSAQKSLEQARQRVASLIDALPDEIVFTSGGTESNNLAIQGVLEAVLNKSVDVSVNRNVNGNVDKKVSGSKPHIVSSVIEHPSVLEILSALEIKGLCDVSLVPVGEDGILDLKCLKESLRPETVLVTIQYVNNEIGTIQPIKEIAKIVRYHRKHITDNAFPYIHSDACQAPVYIKLRMSALGIDMMTLDAGKIYGIRSVGMLYKRRGVTIKPVVYGGSQEMGLRAGTENTAGVVAFAKALELCQSQTDIDCESERIRGLRNDLLKTLVQNIPKLKINGSMKDGERLPNNINICLEGIDAEFAVLKLDVKGVYVSSVTSCRSKNEDSSSYVVSALQNNLVDCSKSSLRITLGRWTTKRDIKKAGEIISKCLTDMI
jgi:cysteine desulfurase